MDELAAPISDCGLEETVGDDTTAFAPILGGVPTVVAREHARSSCKCLGASDAEARVAAHLAPLCIRMGPGDNGQSFCAWILAPTGLGYSGRLLPPPPPSTGGAIVTESSGWRQCLRLPQRREARPPQRPHDKSLTESTAIRKKVFSSETVVL